MNKEPYLMYYERLLTYLNSLTSGQTIIPTVRGSFQLVVERENNEITGITVTGLRADPFIRIEAFEKAIQFIYESPNHTALRGNNTNGPLMFPINTIDAYVAHYAYDIPIGTNALRRITHIAGLLIAANVCEYNRPYLKIRD